MTFKDFLVSKGISFSEEDGCISVDDNDLYPYEVELKQAVPGAELWNDYLRYRNEPKRSTDGNI